MTYKYNGKKKTEKKPIATASLIAGKLRGLQPLGKGSPLVARVKSNSITQTEISVSCMKNSTLPAYARKKKLINVTAE
jgi:hypothetical protein